jgi:tetratricopeptide (TPR) repeat protein
MLPAGTHVGPYRIVSYLDHGGFSEVYRAQSTRDGRFVALKVISRNQDEELIAAERLGASLQRQFEQAHGMVPRTFDVDQDDHYFYIGMACVEGPCLAAEIARGPVDPFRAARHGVLICQFLERAHRFATEIEGVRYDKVIHADLKPSHIFVSSDGHITVLDFGIAKALENSRTAKTIRFVTPLYASPQRLTTGRGSEQDDLWALGVVLYEMIRGKRPHAAIEDPPAYARVSRAIENNAARERLPVSCPAGLAAIIDKSLRYQEDLRYESAAAMRADLETFLRNESPAALKRFATPSTMKVEAHTSALAEPAAVVPTLPRPADPDMTPAAGAGAAVAVAAPPARTVIVRRPTIVRRAAWVGILMASLAIFTSEAVAWFAAERMRAVLHALDVRGVAAARQVYDRSRRWSVFHAGQRLRLDRRLEARLVAAADAVIADYRQEDSTVAEAQWRQAREALDWASQLAPDDRTLEPKRLICDGHIDRIAAQIRGRTKTETQQLYDRAIAEFERAASLDPNAVDPYLGLGRIYTYARRDFDRGTAAMHDAESRGHKPGWRDRALLGDGYRQRADAARRTGARAPEESRRAGLEGARDDYARCVDVLTPILDKARSRYNRDYCQRHRDALNQMLDAEGPDRQ